MAPAWVVPLRPVQKSCLPTAAENLCATVISGVSLAVTGTIRFPEQGGVSALTTR